MANLRSLHPGWVFGAFFAIFVLGSVRLTDYLEDHHGWSIWGSLALVLGVALLIKLLIYGVAYLRRRGQHEELDA